MSRASKVLSLFEDDILPRDKVDQLVKKYSPSTTVTWNKSGRRVTLED